MTVKLNKDGLVPGQAVDYETMKRVTAERKANAEQKATTGKADTDKRKAKNTSTATSKKET